MFVDMGFRARYTDNYKRNGERNDKMAFIPQPKPCFLDGFKVVKIIDNRKVYQRGRLLYTWDGLHGEIEVFDKHGYHMGALDAVTGEQIKPPRKERRLHV